MAKTWAIVITSWICITVIMGLVLWMIQPQYVDWNLVFFILILYTIPIILTLLLLIHEMFKRE